MSMHPVCNPPEGLAYVPRTRRSTRSAVRRAARSGPAYESDSATGNVHGVGVDVGTSEEEASGDRVVGRWGEDTS